MVLFVVAAAFAAPARRAPFKVKQSDGTGLTVVLTGDEALHYYMTLDGKPLVKEPNGDFSYASFSEKGNFVSTKCLAHDNGRRTLYEKNLIASIDYRSMMSEIDKVSAERSAKYRSAVHRAASVPTKGEVNVAVLLVEFPDCRFTYTKKDFENILNTPGYIYKNPFVNSIGSARDYFMAQSDSLFTPNFIVSDIVTLDHEMSFYGANKSNGDDTAPSYAIRHGIIKAADAGYDFSICDNDGDGEVEFVYCIYAGYSESSAADSNTIWPHKWMLSAEAGAVTVNGVKCDNYACSGELVMNEKYEPEIGKVLAGIGLICHEFSHCLGLHDIYDTNGTGNWGMDYWDVMDQGNYVAEGYVPVGYSAYQREVCGWRSIKELGSKGHYSMEPLTRGGTAYKITNDANPDEYYLLENRKREGWDTYLPGSGMLVIHVDYLRSDWDDNVINGTYRHPRYTIIPADNELAVYGKVSMQEFLESLEGDVWPGTTGNTELTNSSIPAAKVYTGGFMNKPITNIEYKRYVISFDFMAGVFGSVPQVMPATEIKEDSFTANWEALEGATCYNVELYKVVDAASGDGDAVSLLQEDFLGCIKSNVDISSNIDDFTGDDGWSAESVFSSAGAVRVGTSVGAGSLRTPLLNATGKVKIAFSSSLYNANDRNPQLTVNVIDSENDTVVYSEVFAPAITDTEYILETYVDGEFYVLFTTGESINEKRVYLDNISVISFNTVRMELVASVERVEACSCSFGNLEAASLYSYRVQGNDGYGVSEFSEYENVSLLPLSIEDAVADADFVEVYTLGGIKLCSGHMDGIELTGGVYLIKSGTKAFKAVVK